MIYCFICPVGLYTTGIGVFGPAAGLDLGHMDRDMAQEFVRVLCLLATTWKILSSSKSDLFWVDNFANVDPGHSMA